MKFKAFTLIEILTVFGLILLTAAIIVPNAVEDNKKLAIISKWKHAYKNIEYALTAIKTQVDETDIIAYKKAQTNEQKEQFLFELFNPYFRLGDSVSIDDYKLYYLNGKRVKPEDEFYIKNLHTANSGAVIGIRWLSLNEKQNMPIAIISYDLNGIQKPNKWGYDVFGIYVYTDKIEPIGSDLDEVTRKEDCSKKGKGLACSYNYYIYGGNLN